MHVKNNGRAEPALDACLKQPTKRTRIRSMLGARPIPGNPEIIRIPGLLELQEFQEFPEFLEFQEIQEFQEFLELLD